MEFWQIWIFDVIAGVLLATAVSVLVGLCIHRVRHWMKRRLNLIAVTAGIVGAYLAVYMAYGTLRNQSMLAAHTAINADAGRLLDWERTSPHIRCLYNWESTYDDGDTCLANIATNGDLYSEASLYVEEVFFILKQARSDEQVWRSGYMENIRYWRVGVQDDPTGLFGNYLAIVNSYTSPANTMERVQDDIRAAGIVMPKVCDGYYRVRACFQAAGRDVSVSDACKAEPISGKTARSLPKLVATCTAAAEATMRAKGEAPSTENATLGP